MSGAAAKTRRVEAEEASRRDLSLKPEEADDDSIAPYARLAAHRFSWSRRRRKKIADPLRRWRDHEKL